uniref:Probable deoxycytidylate deaminase n=2 Tax=Parascaris univalens TaxID=6257 RepID=A0A915C604_PARUN
MRSWHNKTKEGVFGMVVDVVKCNDSKKQEVCASVCGTERLATSSSATSAESELTVCDEDRRDHKREEYLSWEEYFMAVACLAAQRSKDPITQVGAVIVNPDLKIIGSGYNGMPNGCSDDVMPWGKDSDNPLETKYPFVCHAEMNAVLNRNCESVKGSTIYTVLFPCNECAKLIIQAGISEVVYKRDKPDKVEVIASKKMFDITGVRYRQFHSKRQVFIDFGSEVRDAVLGAPEGTLQLNGLYSS